MHKAPALLELTPERAAARMIELSRALPGADLSVVVLARPHLLVDEARVPAAPVVTLHRVPQHAQQRDHTARAGRRRHRARVQDGAAAAAKVVAIMRKVMPHADTPRELDGKSGVWYAFLSLLDSRSGMPGPRGAARGEPDEAMRCNI